jgi:DNA end-binding protein Ku
MARAMWKAVVALGDVEVPVKLYAAVEDRGIHFRLLHAKDHVPVVQRMVDPTSGEQVPRGEERRGLEVEPGVFVALDDDELAETAPKASRTIEITRVVPRAAVDIGWYRRPYLLGPDGEEEDYCALARALAGAERVAIARWVMRGSRYVGALAPHGAHLALVAMQFADEVVSADQLARPEGPAVSKAERKLAEQLVSALDAPFDPAMLRDEHRERVQELIAAKAEGRRFTFEKAPRRKAPGDLGDALRASLRAAKGGRGKEQAVA